MITRIVLALFVFLLTTGITEIRAEGSELFKQIAALLSDESYETKVAAVREEFAAERRASNCDTVTDFGTPESDLGRPKCHNVGGRGQHMGGGLSLTAAAKTANSSSCLSSSKGAPVWAVNMVNMNFYMEDTPLWYRSPVGPSVEIVFSYNSWYPIDWGQPVANKWVMNYGTHLMEYSDAVSSGMWVVLPDGKHDQYPVNGVANGWETYASPYNTYTKLSRISQSRFELQFPEGKVYVYDVPQGSSSAVALLVEEKDAYGQKLTFGYDSNDKLITITDALGKITNFSYVGGNISQITDPFGRSAYFEYDAGGNLTKTTDMGGYWTSFAYDANLLPAGLTNGQGSWGFYFEPPDGIPNGGDPYPAPGTAMDKSYRITVTNPDGGKEEYYRGVGAWYISPKNYVPYVSASNNNYASHPAKTTYNFSWDQNTDRGEVITIISPIGIETGFSYDSNGNITGMSVPGGSVAFTYNGLGKVTSVTDGTTLTAPVTTMTYAGNNVDLTGITDGLGTVTLAYNGFHDVTSITDRLNNTTTFTYNGNGQITSETDQLAFVTTYAYDSNHLLSQVTKEGQNLRSYTYDSLGRVQTFTDASGMTLTFDYNNLDDITTITYFDGKFVIMEYSTAVPHQIISVTDRGGRITDYAYTASKLLTGIMNAEGGIIGFDYDANGKMSKLTDPLGNASEFVHNNDNKLVQKKFADLSSVSFAYDDLQGSGRLSSSTNARGFPVQYGYMLGDLETMASISSYGNFSYDEYHRLTGANDYIDYYVYGYDGNSRLTSVDGPLPDDTITFGYDAKGRRTSYALEGGQTVSYTYDALDRLTEIQNSAGTFTYNYSSASPLVQSLIRPNGSYTEYQYDTLNRLTALTNKRSGGTIINQYVYSYNDQDLRASETVTNGTPMILAAESSTYSYNNLNQLISSSGSSGTFLYDGDGNMTQGYTPAGYALDADYDAQNRLTWIQYTGPDQCSIPGYPQYTTPCPHSKTFHYRYDGILARVEKEDSFYGTSLTVTNYVNDGMLPLQERDESNNVLREYTWGLNYGGGIGGLLGLRQAGQDYYYLYDGKGNVTALLDSSENIVATYAYDPFGKLMTKSGSLDQPYQFSTKPYDEEAGLSYYGYRFYSPEIGRWTNRDPIGEAGGFNLYGFAWDNPLSYIDPNGEIIIPILIGVGIGVAYVFVDWYADRETANEIMEKSAKRTGEKALKKLTHTNVPRPADCKEYEDILKGTKQTAEEGVDPYRRVMGNTIRGINEGMTGSNSNTPLGTAPRRRTISQWQNM